jgi:hypothetical protein
MCAWAAPQALGYRGETTVALGPADSLRDMAALSVATILDSDTPLSGLSASKLQTDVELRLRTFGIHVVNSEEASSLPGGPVLHVNVHVLKSTLLHVYSVTVELHQSAALKRMPSLEARAATWQNSMLAFVTTVGDPSDKILETLRNSLDKFINDYLAANPK